MRTLKLTEPYMRGEDVRALQLALRDNPYGDYFGRREVDGIFGPITAQRSAASKWHLGYQVENIAPTAGEQLYRYLTNLLVPLTPEMLARRAARIERMKKNRTNPVRRLRLAALEIARRDVGVIEGPGNDVKYNRWWCAGRNDGGAYCVRAGAYWYAMAGSSAVRKGVHWENTDALLFDAQQERNGVDVDPDPDPGCGFVIDWDGHIDPDHFGLYVADAGGGYFKSLEANATLANGRQGVGYHLRPYAHCWFVVFRS